MDKMVYIEFQDKLGNWKRFSTVEENWAHIKQALNAASKHRPSVQLRVVRSNSGEVLLTDQGWQLKKNNPQQRFEAEGRGLNKGRE